MTDFLYLPAQATDPGEWEREVRKHPEFTGVLVAARAAYATAEWTPAGIQAATAQAGGIAGVTQLGKAQAPVRLAVTGRSVGPPLWESLAVLGRDRTIARLDASLARLDATGPG